MYSLRTITQPTVEPVSLDRFKAHLRLDSDDEDDLLGSYLRGARSLLEQTTQRAFMPQTVAFGLDRFPFGWFGMRSTLHASSSVPGWVDHFTIRLPRPACLSVESITYRDANSNMQTLDAAAFLVDFDSEPARIVPASGYIWPIDAFLLPGSVKVTYVAGSYADAIDEQLTVTAGSDGGPAIVQLSETYAGGAYTLTQGDTTIAATLNASNALVLPNSALVGQQVTASYYGMNVPPHVETAILMLAAHWFRNRETASDTLMKEIPMGVQSLIAPEISYAGQFEL